MTRGPALAAGAAAAVVLAGAAAAGRSLLVGCVIATQLGLAASWLRAAAIPALGVPLAITVAVAAAVDLLGQAGGGDRLGRLAAVVGVAFLGMLLGELVRRDRSRVTDSLVATASAVVLVVMLASPLALAPSRSGRAVVGATFAAVAAALAVAAVGAVVGAAAGGRADNGLGAAATLILAVVAGGGVGAAYGSVSQHGPRWGVAVGLAAALFAAAGWALTVGSTDHSTAPRAAGALRPSAPVMALLPLALAAPVGYAAGRLLGW
jgi:hypothetical protein